MANQKMLIGGVAVLGVAAYFLTQNEATTLEDTQATSYTQISGDGSTADNRSEAIVDVKDLLGDCSTNSAGEETGGDTSNTCIVPLWDATPLTVIIEHPIALDTQLSESEREKYDDYYFTVTIDSDITSSMTESAWESYDDSQVIGDYRISVERSGDWQPDRRWTANQNADFNGSSSTGAYITKGNAMAPAESVMLTWNECLAAFGGYMDGKVAATGNDIIIRQGIFEDVGYWQYEKQGADGNAYPVLVDKFGLDMQGQVIPMYAQLQYRCSTSDSWISSGARVQVDSTNILEMVGDNIDGATCYKPCFPAIIPTSGVALGCSLPTVSITFPSKIHVMCDPNDANQDCSQVPVSVLGNPSYIEWWNLNPAITPPTTMQKGGWTTPSGAVWSKLFDAYLTPKVYSDSQGWYVYAGSGGTNNPTKHYINSVLGGFMAAYTRQSKTCTCPSDTNNAGQSYTLLDKSKCHNQVTVVGGSQEWKTTYCGGLKPDYGCTDVRASNYNSNKVKDPTDTDVCNPKYCTYPADVALPECQGIGGGQAFPGSGGGVGEAPPPGEGDDTDETPPNIGGLLSGIDNNSGNSGSVDYSSLLAENVISPTKLINTSQSFLNW